MFSLLTQQASGGTQLRVLGSRRRLSPGAAERMERPRVRSAPAPTALPLVKPESPKPRTQSEREEREPRKPGAGATRETTPGQRSETRVRRSVERADHPAPWPTPAAPSTSHPGPAASSPRGDRCSPGGGAQTCPRGAPAEPRPCTVAPSRAPGATDRASEGRGADRAEASPGLGPGARRTAPGEGSVAGKNPT
jgi:hypothetical protein